MEDGLLEGLELAEVGELCAFELKALLDVDVEVLVLSAVWVVVDGLEVGVAVDVLEVGVAVDGLEVGVVVDVVGSLL